MGQDSVADLADVVRRAGSRELRQQVFCGFAIRVGYASGHSVHDLRDPAHVIGGDLTVCQSCCGARQLRVSRLAVEIVEGSYPAHRVDAAAGVGAGYPQRLHQEPLHRLRAGPGRQGSLLGFDQQAMVHRCQSARATLHIPHRLYQLFIRQRYQCLFGQLGNRSEQRSRDLLDVLPGVRMHVRILSRRGGVCTPSVCVDFGTHSEQVTEKACVADGFTHEKAQELEVIDNAQ